MTKLLRLAAVQANPTVGDVAGNLALAKRHVRALKDADLVVFTECFLTGYPLEDLVRRPGFRAKVRDAVADFASFVRELDGPAVVLGAPIDGVDLPHNAALTFLPDGTIRPACKRDLPNVDVFDEVRTFAPGAASKPVAVGGFRIGVGVCEEMWHPMVPAELAGSLASLLVFINGSPFEDGKQTLRHEIARRRARETGLPLVYVNQVGGQDELVFDGASFAVNRRGHLVAQLPAFREGVLRLILSDTPDGFELEPAENGVAVAPYADRLQALYEGATLALRDYVEKGGFPGVVIGLSGGVDSALTAAIAVDALGPERVHCRMMPSGFTAAESIADAKDCAALLGVEHGVLPIGPTADAARGVLAGEFTGLPEDTTEENIQARVRGLLLMALSNKRGWLVVATGNKSEMSVGYSTLYGDMCGGYALLKDIYKTDVFALARWRNANVPEGGLGPRGRAVPERILTKAPSAELKAGQTDEAALGPYEDLDAVLKMLVENELDPESAARAASRALKRTIPAAYAERIARLVKSAEFKRRQSAPGPKLTSRPFGKGWRYPIVNKTAL